MLKVSYSNRHAALYKRQYQNVEFLPQTFFQIWIFDQNEKKLNFRTLQKNCDEIQNLCTGVCRESFK